ncbi:putative AsnC-family transcriptional regulator [Actinoplanes missouriensis 431]|uniref:Putative AsnC-family transcriptional regulator n=1 Tax=Actinoplanes missouriensis (strain ATCC 14538 / DSM 43046 / CBS 188.64 / JCM 3121 / NBRC 102363 / NCIMB 12654 / NRRL B-3342 / UNCC 431) TaxID=512565 RepID=I0H5Z6_ACTM4|nr:Lrp/AsnC family transcriptional regulator [Actinoplanes missouriensis]BAL88433.1 putative AsnC-family transcriptional regulator [Actinoplanes missouriensis 431]
MALRSERSLDPLDWQLIKELQADARLSFKELGRRVSLSPPAVAERVRRLEEAGVIVGYAARVDPRSTGYPFLAFVQLRCASGRCLLQNASAAQYPEVSEIHKLSGTHCSLLKVRATSLEHLEVLLERLGRHGELTSSLVLSTQYDDQRVTPPPAEHPAATRHEGWR